jgi:hypothetical protein
VPLFSPDSQEVISVADCIQYECAHDLEIWKRAGDHFVFEWGHKPAPIYDEVSINLRRWDQPDRITTEFSTSGLVPPTERWRALIVREGGRWRLEANIPARLLARPNSVGK